jgi:hypothetical protein
VALSNAKRDFLDSIQSIFFLARVNPRVNGKGKRHREGREKTLFAF